MAKNIIIIDDNLTNIKLVTKVLSKEGYNVHSALFVRDGLKLMKMHRMSLVLMDAMMPDIDGFEGIKLIRTDEDFRNIPIIMVTALISTKYDAVEAMSAGADDYLTKPYNIKDLVSKIKTLIGISDFV